MITINLENQRWAFEPGEKVAGEVAWNLQRAVNAMEIRLKWSTSGKGTRDSGMVRTMVMNGPPISGVQQFSFDVPPGPYTFSGRLVSLAWVIEAATVPEYQASERPIVIAPGAAEIVLP